MNTKQYLPSLCLSLLLTASQAFAAPILIDYSGGAAAPTLGGVWNTIGSLAAGQPLLDAAGAASGITLSFGGGWSLSSNDQGAWPSGDKDWVDGDATADYFFNDDGGNSTVIFSGLTPGALYQFDHVAARAIESNRIADYTIFGAYADSTPNGDDYSSLNDGWTPGGILTWTSVTADGAGQIVFRVNDVKNFGYLSASRLTALSATVPEPGTLGLFGAGALFLLARRRRRS